LPRWRGNAVLSREPARLALGIAAIAAVTGASFWLHATLASVAFTFLVLIVLLSLVCSLPSLIAVSVIAVGCLDYFFTDPVFTFRVIYPDDVIALISFFFTALVITTLIRRMRVQHDERVEAYERLRDSQAQLAHAGRLMALGELSASIGHELKQPLTATIANVQAASHWIQRQPPELNEVQQALDRILRDNTRAVQVLERIRALGRSEAARADRVDINSAILEVVDLARSEIVKNEVAARTDLAEGLPFVKGDRVELQQVVLNLVMNAIEAMSSAQTRELTITTRKGAGREVSVAVQDSGCGLTADQHKYLFQPFYSTKPSGLGLGMSICRVIVEKHGGRLWAVPGVSEGAIFQFTVPEYPNSHGPVAGKGRNA